MNTGYIEKLRSEYIESHLFEQERERLIEENNIEKDSVKGYHGREILELLQNADDAYQKSKESGSVPDEPLHVTIRLRNNTLTIANTGTFFDKDGIKAIVQGNNSPKTGKYLGNKGTGFRSVLNWASCVKIFSGEFAVEFSEEIANSELDKIRHKPQISSQLEKRPDLHIPMLAVPRNTAFDRSPNLTTIEIEINPEKSTDDFSAPRQLSEIDSNILLFLPNTEAITIETEEGVTKIEREKRPDDTVMLREFKNGVQEFENSWHLFTKTIPGKEDGNNSTKEIRLAIALPESQSSLPQPLYLYTYFPLLHAHSDFNCLLNATYDLGADRNTIPRTAINKQVIREQLEFIIEVAKKLASNNCEAEACRLLLPRRFSASEGSLLTTFGYADLEDDFLRKVAELKIFRTVTGRKVALCDNVRRIKGDFPEVFRGDHFGNLLERSSDPQRDSLLDLLPARLGINIDYSAEELSEAISRACGGWEIDDEAEVFVWWNDYFRDSAILPPLLADSSNNPLEAGRSYYFLEGDTATLTLPQWVKIPSLSDASQRAVLSTVKMSIRDICQKERFPCVDFQYRDRNNIIPTVNSSIDNDYQRAKEFVKWLWDNYSSRELNSESLKESLKFPAKDGTVVNTHTLYFGADYGNALACKIFGNGYHEFPSPDELQIADNETAKFHSFISFFGVHDYPEIKVKKAARIAEDYHKLITDKILKDETITSIRDIDYTMELIDNLDQLLTSLPMLDIIRWISESQELRACLNAPYSKDSKIHYKGDYQKNHRPFNGDIDNYILYLFNHRKWIEINGRRHKPVEVLDGLSNAKNNDFSSLHPVLTEELAASLSSQSNVNVHDIFRMFRLAKDVTQLNSSDFYNILLSISGADTAENHKLFKRIYTIIERSDCKRDQFESSVSKTQYFQQGKMLVTMGGKTMLRAVSQSYLPSTRIVDKRSVAIVDKGSRTNNERFKNIFGCKEWNNDYTVDAGSAVDSPANAQFQQYLTTFLKYAKYYGHRNDNISQTIGRLEVKLAQSVEIIENNNFRKRIDTPDSLIRCNESKWIIIYPDGQCDNFRLSLRIEDIFANIANTPGFDAGKLGELFRAPDDRSRSFLIEKEFGTLDGLDYPDNGSELREQFITAMAAHGVTEQDIDEAGLNFCNLGEERSLRGLIGLLRKAGADIGDLTGFPAPNLTNYWRGRMQEAIAREERAFVNQLFTLAIADETLQQTFIYTRNRFHNYANEASIPNSVNFNPQAELLKVFALGDEPDKVIDANAAYNSNFERMNPPEALYDDISNSEEAQRMIYFGKDEEFRKWVSSHMESVESSSETQPDPYAHLRNVVPSIGELTMSEPRDPSDNSGTRRPTGGGSYSRKKQDKADENRKRIGNIGELLIYNYLRDKYGAENIEPRSEAFRALKIIKAGQDKSGDYDLSFLDEDGTKVMVEVKTSSGRNKFYMSAAELDFAQKQARQGNRYLLAYVWDYDTDPKFCFLPERFWERGEFRKREIIERVEFSF